VVYFFFAGGDGAFLAAEGRRDVSSSIVGPDVEMAA